MRRTETQREIQNVKSQCFINIVNRIEETEHQFVKENNNHSSQHLKVGGQRKSILANNKVINVGKVGNRSANKSINGKISRFN